MALQNIPVIDRIPPQNLEAEMALLGSILVDREIMAVVAEIVKPQDFYAHVHESIYQAIVQLYDRGEPLDKITVSEELKRRGILEKVGGLSYLSSLMDTVQTAASATYYAKIVREKSTLRGLIHAGTQISQIGFESEEDVDGALDRCEQLVYEVGTHQLSGEFTQVNRLLKPAFEQIDRLFHRKGDRTGFTTGFRDIDAMTTGLQPGNFVIVAARPGMGKTSLALNMAAAAAEAEQQPVAFFSLEMTNDELVQRLICAEARLNSIDLRKGNIKPNQWEEISRAMGVLNELPIFLDDQGAITVSEIRSRCRRLKSGHGLGAVFIDYLQLVRPVLTTKSGNRNEELSEICRTLKATAKDLQVPIVALAQLNRGVESRNDKRPMLSDLRDCLAGASLVTNADTGERIALKEIVQNRLRFNVWALDEQLKMTRRPITDAWEVGEKQVYFVTTQSGRTIRCTDGHRFFSADGWQELRKLKPADSIAVPRADKAYAPYALRVSGAPIAGADILGRSPAASTALLEGSDDEWHIEDQSDILWDPIVSLEPDGVEMVYDITVGELHNFCVDGFVTHNSGAIEQEADMVGFLYRDGYYNHESPEPDLTEFIIAKQRNGPTGMVKLRFLKEHTMFVPYGDESHYSPA
jgi:replicative DNA helicase